MDAHLVSFLCLLGGYLCGSVMFAPLFAKISGKGTDVYTNGNKNPGAANTFKTVGKVWGILTGVLDAAKALVPMLLGSFVLGLTTVQVGLIGVGAAIGHGYPLYFRFKGGHGAATLMGIYAFFIPYELLISLIIAPPIIFKFFRKNVSLRIPATTLTISSFLMFFFDHAPEVRTMAFICGLCTLYFNRERFVNLVKNVFAKKKVQNDAQQK